MPKLWNDIDGEPWLDNPRKRRRSKGRKRRRRGRGRFKKGSAAAKRFMASIRPKRRGRRRKKLAASGGIMARRSKRRSRGRRGRRHFRSNPPRFSVRGIGGRVMDGLKGGAGVVLGEAAAGAIPSLIPVAALQSGPLNVAAQAAVGIFLAPFVGRTIGGEWGKAFLWGAFARPLRNLVQQLGVPILAPALAAYPGNLAAYPGNLAALPSGRASTLTLGDMMAEEEDFSVV